MRMSNAWRWKGRGKKTPPAPRWKRVLRRDAAPPPSRWGRIKERVQPRSRSKQQAERLRRDARAAASNRWARGAAAVGVTTAGVVALARRHSQTPDDSTSETPGPDAQAGAFGGEGTET